ncbi:MAG: type II secretion system protein M [Proteobacteria bacterium]|nr:type II secretion system protein M [Pseudomonadota bacterium]MBU1058033.1 type II secretion system protein M [Pseudomonadota bacterium]
MTLSSLPTLLQPLIEKIGWERMVKREKIMLAGLVLFAGSVLLFHFLFSPLLDSRQRLKNSISVKETELQQIRDLQKEYQALQHQTGDIQERISNRPKAFTLFSFIELQAAEAKIKEQISYLKPSEIEGESALKESRVDMKLQRINLDDLVNFLKGLESPKDVVFINRISIQEHGKDEGYVNAVIQIITFREA